MPTSADPLLLDTSAAIALVTDGHPGHAAVLGRVRGRPLGLAGHAEFETYSVLTRLPPPRRLSAAAALRLIRTNFPHSRHVPPAIGALALEEFAEQGIGGGAVYDGLVGLAARHHDLPLVSCDRRAVPTYRVVGVEVDLVGAP